MKIQNNYHAYSGGEYQKSHTYSMPENSRGSGAETEDGEKSSRAAYGPAKGKEADIFIHTPESGKERGEGSKKGVGLLREFWDAMGDESKEGKTALEEEAQETGEQREIYGIPEVFGQFFSRRVTVNWMEFKDKVKAGADVAFQSFEKKKDDFFALADPKNFFRKNFRKKREEKQKRRELAEKRARRQKDILTANTDSPLMDSYSKRGEYCKLNDNLSYRRKRMEENRKAFSERKS